MIRFTLLLYALAFSANGVFFDQRLNQLYSPNGGVLIVDPEEELQQYEQSPIYEEELRIPGETPRTNDSYLCTAFRQLGHKSIVSFEPLSTENAHHVIMFVCEQPGIYQPVPAWDCGEMSTGQAGQPSQYVKAPPCASTSAPIYAWSHGAGQEKTELPEGVGFPVGGYSNNQFVVLQVHYMSAVEKEDYAGVRVRFTNVPQPKTAATLLLVTGGEVQSQKKETFEAACVVDEDVEMHPISFRVHTHRHGEKVSGWVVKEDEKGEDAWFALGERSPQLPQLFEPIKNASIVIGQGDILASKCTINNNENHPIEIGPTSEDEMCNFYLMYWTEGQTLSNNVCYSPGPPNYRWAREAALNHIPQ